MRKKRSYRKFIPVIFIAVAVLFFLSKVYEKDKRTEYYSSGEIKQEYYVNSEGGADGRLTEYFEGGSISSLVDFKDGKQHGWSQFFHKNGTMRKKTYFENGVQQDTLVTFYSDGVVETAFSIRDGKKHGHYVYYFGNSKKKEEGIYQNDKLEGEVVSYNNSGQVAARGYYDSGARYALIRDANGTQEYISFPAGFNVTMPSSFKLDSVSSNTFALFKNKEEGISLMMGANASSQPLSIEVSKQTKEAQGANNLKEVSMEEMVIGDVKAQSVVLLNNDSNEYLNLFFLKKDDTLINIYFFVPASKMAEHESSMHEILKSFSFEAA
ncbi:toxin-antitoxin system YwqK family antitoxin [Pontibacter russatus]|uniref:toxin-antitoxin system YwqK family antitoxin n=1 Tax=Pontibacter russatus TaxID=2694929 RepID=UPI00137A684C|nr:toxin-antitoxin system YwqK family antitoxin [Pontibacter russatus]